VSVDDRRLQRRGNDTTVLRVLLVDDHPVVRLGLTMALERAGGFTVCGEADTVASARERVAELRPDLLVLDLTLGGRDGTELVADVIAIHPDVKVLVFSAMPELTYARHVFRAGAHGYMMKDHGVEQVPSALAAIARGERYASAAVRSALFDAFVSGAAPLDAGDPVSTLSARELQVLRLIAAARAVGDIARELHVSVKTVGTHRDRLKEKLGVDTARDLLRLAGDLQRGGRV
jgi:DNA-binding NarL/FixJ family response regulator